MKQQSDTGVLELFKSQIKADGTLVLSKELTALLFKWIESQIEIRDEMRSLVSEASGALSLSSHGDA